VGEIGRLAFTHRLGIAKRSGISQFRFHRFIYRGGLRWYGYIV